MNISIHLPAMVTAFMAGILGSGHCFGMCGGIAGSFGVMSGPAESGSRLLPALVFNLGRLSSYMLLGGIFAVLAAAGGEMLHVPGWSDILRMLTAGMILLIGLQFLFGLRWLDSLERLGAGVWRKVQPLAVRIASWPGAVGRILLGLCWGLIPCGLVYSVLLTAASTASFVSGNLVMLAFGAGTLPSMLGVAWMSSSFGSLRRDPWLRRLIGFSLIVLSTWTFFMVLNGSEQMHAH